MPPRELQRPGALDTNQTQTQDVSYDEPPEPAHADPTATHPVGSTSQQHNSPSLNDNSTAHHPLQQQQQHGQVAFPAGGPHGPASQPPAPPPLVGLAADLAGVASADGGVYAVPQDASTAVGDAARNVMPRGGGGSGRGPGIFAGHHASLAPAVMKEQYGLALQLAEQPLGGLLPPVLSTFPAPPMAPQRPTSARVSVPEPAATPGVRGKAFGVRRGFAETLKIPPPPRLPPLSRSPSHSGGGGGYALPGADPFSSDGGAMPVVVQGGPEADYGMVTELKAVAPDDPFESGFGMAAEVARRRDRERSPFARPSGRPGRRRLAPYGLSGDDALDSEMQRRSAARAAQLADPFGAANMASATDPFDIAGEEIKVPGEMPTRGEQDFPDDRVNVLHPGDGSETGYVSGDDDEYGLALELGLSKEEAEARRAAAREARRQLEAQGIMAFDENGRPIEYDEAALANGLPRYVYDPDTGLLRATDVGKGEGSRKARQYIEDRATGDFYKLNGARFFRWFRRKDPQPQRRDAYDDDEEEESTFRTKLRFTLFWLTNIFAIIGTFVQGLLAGFALLNFFMTYFLYNGNDLKDFLRYYAYVALDASRIYYSLTCLALIAASARFARDKLRDFQPRNLGLRIVDFFQVLCYLAAYIMTIILTPVEDTINYEYKRNPYFYNITFNSQFINQLTLFHVLNTLRAIFCGLAYIGVCYQSSPAVMESMAAYEAGRRWQASATMARAAALLANKGKHAYGAGTR